MSNYTFIFLTIFQKTTKVENIFEIMTIDFLKGLEAETSIFVINNAVFKMFIF